MSDNPLQDKYGGIPDVGGYLSHTEYEVGHGWYAEAAHCILGSLGKAEYNPNSPDYDLILSVEKGHISEELNLMEGAIIEYSRQVYDNQNFRGKQENSKYFNASVPSIQEASDSLVTVARKQKAKIGAIRDTQVRQLASDVYDALIILGLKAQGFHSGNAGRFNVWRDPEIKNAVVKVRKSAEAIYGPLYRKHGSTPRDLYITNCPIISDPEMDLKELPKAFSNAIQMALGLLSKAGIHDDIKIGLRKFAGDQQCWLALYERMSQFEAPPRFWVNTQTPGIIDAAVLPQDMTVEDVMIDSVLHEYAHVIEEYSRLGDGGEEMHDLIYGPFSDEEDFAEYMVDFFRYHKDQKRVDVARKVVKLYIEDVFSV